MFFSRKGKLRQEKDQKLMSLIYQLKDDWTNNKQVVQKSVEPSDELMYDYYLSEALYFYSVREAKARKVSMK